MAKTKQVEIDVDEQALADINRKYVYVLAMKNEPRGRVFTEDGRPIKDPEYPPRRNLLLRSSIVWPGGNDPFTEGKVRKKGKYLIRFYDGCSTLFVDDQPRDKESIDQLVKSTRELYFINGYLEVYGYDTMLKAYMDMASWNGESPFRIATAQGIYQMLDVEKSLLEEDARIDRIELAMKYAKEAPEKKMRVHARFLNIADVDLKTSFPLSEKALRADYRKEAMRDHENFIKTYNDKTIQLRSWIEKSLDNGEISTSLIPNKAVWKAKGVEICDISGLTSREGILNRLIEVTQTEAGIEFVDILKAIHE